MLPRLTFGPDFWTGQLEERAAEAGCDPGLPVRFDLRLDVLREVAGAPAELDDVDVARGRRQHILDLAEAESLIEHVSEALFPRLGGAPGKRQEATHALTLQRNSS